jgi:beta-lactamase class A
LNRRDFLAATSCLASFPALAAVAHDPLLAYEAASGGRIGVYAENVATGQTMSWRADARFVMCSTFKASLVALTLARIDAGKEALASTLRFGSRDMLEYAPVAAEHLAAGTMSVEAACAGAVELSDNTCANLLLARAGGPAMLTRFWRSTGDAISRLDHDEPLLNRTPPGASQDTTTPRAMAGTLRRLVLGDVLSSASRERLTNWMVNCKTGSRRLRAGLPADWKIADKTGNNGKDGAGDIAVAWTPVKSPVLICAFTRGGAPTADQLQAVFAAIGRSVGERLA